MARLQFVVPDHWDGQRLDTFLRNEHFLSGSTLRKARWHPMGLTMDGHHIRTVDPIRSGATILVDTGSEYAQYDHLDLPVPVIYEDDWMKVFNKPPALATHPSKGHPFDTLANVFAAQPSTAGMPYRPVGRLDQDTSGVLVAAKHAHAAHLLAMGMKKRYLALVSGIPPTKEGTIQCPIGRQAPGDVLRCVTPDGQAAVTHYRLIASQSRYSLVELWLETRRTHQIRVHMSHIGCPLIGDTLYGGNLSLASRHLLHCYLVSWNSYPSTAQPLVLSAPAAEDMSTVIHQLFPSVNAEELIMSLATHLKKQSHPF